MGRRGVGVTLKHVQRMIDRHGHERFYFRKPGLPRVTLPGKPGDATFLSAYQAAVNGAPLPVTARDLGAPKGTFARLIDDYFDSPRFLRTRASSQGVTKRILDRFARDHGHRLVAEMEYAHVAAIIGKMHETPAAANNLLKKLRAVLRFAIATGLRTDDPTIGMDKFREGTHHTWTDAELAQFEARWPTGTRQRTSYAMALYTGQRRADLVRASWRDYDAKAGTIMVIQEKTRAELEIPVHRDLRATLEAWPQRHLSILATDGGRGTSVASFGNFMADAIHAAGLPSRCVLHGLRKAAGRKLADAGCSAHMIMSILGHKSLSEAQRYTQAYEQKHLAQAAIRAWEGAKVSTLHPAGLQRGEKLK